MMKPNFCTPRISFRVFILLIILTFYWPDKADGQAVTDPTKRWNNGVVPYTIDPRYSKIHLMILSVDSIEILIISFKKKINVVMHSFKREANHRVRNQRIRKIHVH